jgi:primosomal protein N' (replication factor Y) (superfamily II helicase)
VPIARVALPVAARETFDYWVPEGLRAERGSVVEVSLAQRKLVGVVTEIVATSTLTPERLHPIGAVAPIAGLPDDVLALGEFVSSYYQEPLGLALALAVPPVRGNRPTRTMLAEDFRLTGAGREALPAALPRAPAARRLLESLLAQEGRITVAQIAALPAHGRRTLRAWCDRGWLEATGSANETQQTSRELNAAQDDAVATISAAAGTFAAFLLFGVTGSGKTDVYLAAAAQVIAGGGQVLLLVPEINLTPQLAQRMRDGLPGVRIAMLHSGLAAGERGREWHAAASGDAALVLGTRLAVFAPLPALRLVIVDEEQDTSYKQQDNVRYHARDAAIWRANRRGVPIVLGSATPSLESWQHALAQRYRRLDLLRRADPRATLPEVRLVGNRPARLLDGVGDALRDGIAQRLERGEQALVFVNRRGFAPSLICAACKWEAHCPRCSVRLTAHRHPPLLRCHHCGHDERVPRGCPSCGNVDLLPLGFGTQRLEAALRAAFPHARIARVDRDTTMRKGAFAAVRDQVAANTLDILVGTQMLAKGHDFPRLTLVGVLGADNALYSADFRATERLFALLMQVAGRAGRAGLPGEVIVQTDFPEHSVYAALVAHDYARFADALLQEREAAALPPLTSAALLVAEAHQREVTDAFLHFAHAEATTLARGAHPEVEVFGVVPALLARRAGFERGQIVVQSTRRAALQRFLPAWREAFAGATLARRVRWSLDVDPAGFG